MIEIIEDNDNYTELYYISYIDYTASSPLLMKTYYVMPVALDIGQWFFVMNLPKNHAGLVPEPLVNHILIELKTLYPNLKFAASKS